MESVTMAVREPRECDAAKDYRTDGRFDTGSNRCKAPIIYIKADTGEPSVRQPGVRGPV
jgi:hypothetical protein